VFGTIAILVALAAAPVAPATPEKPKIAVMDTQAGGVEAHVAAALTEAITQEVAARGYFRVISSKEIQTLLGFERQKQVAGCSSETTSCLAELADAMGARYVLSSTLSKMGDAYQLSLQTLDSARAQPLGRSVRIAKDIATLQAQLAYSVADATATPLPPPPSRVLPYSLIGAGGLVAVGGVVFGIDGISRDLALGRQIAAGPSQTLAAYEEEAKSIGTSKTLGLVGMLAGAALIAGGIFLNPPDLVGPAKVALLPTASGAALVGVFQ
jgi:TolB-like protein